MKPALAVSWPPADISLIATPFRSVTMSLILPPLDPAPLAGLSLRRFGDASSTGRTSISHLFAAMSANGTRAHNSRRARTCARAMAHERDEGLAELRGCSEVEFVELPRVDRIDPQIDHRLAVGL